MASTHHSEYLPLQTVFIKPAKEAFMSNTAIQQQWEELNYLHAPDFEKATKEYDEFQDFFNRQGVTVKQFQEDSTVSIDSIYCRDAAIATDYGVILCNMGKKGRLLEPEAQRKVFQEQNIPILGSIQSPGTLEGGDVAWLDEKTLAVGHTYRTNEEGIRQLKSLLEPHGITIIVADLPHYKGEEDVFHLMSILSPIDKNLAVVYSPLMPIKFRNELVSRGIRLVEVPEEEFESMGCNVLAVAPSICLMVAGNPKTKQAIEAAGAKVHTYQGEHISVYGGGGPTCLTRPMERSL